MKKAIILHGMADSQEEYDGNQAEHHWIPWLKSELEARGVEVQTPELSVPYAPDYEAWRGVFEGLASDEETILVGHSCGGGFLVRYLSENDVKVGKVVLVAPYLDPDGDHIPEFFDFSIKRNLVAQTAGVTIFVSTDDDWDILESTRIIKEGCDDVEVREFTHHGHFCLSDMGTSEFPELLEKIMQ